MTREQVKMLQQGDEITLNSPTDNFRTDIILSIEVVNDVAEIVWRNGDYTECFVFELS